MMMMVMEDVADRFPDEVVAVGPPLRQSKKSPSQRLC